MASLPGEEEEEESAAKGVAKIIVVAGKVRRKFCESDLNLGRQGASHMHVSCDLFAKL